MEMNPEWDYNSGCHAPLSLAFLIIPAEYENRGFMAVFYRGGKHSLVQYFSEDIFNLEPQAA
jgi:hypothetical protein